MSEAKEPSATSPADPVRENHNGKEAPSDRRAFALAGAHVLDIHRADRERVLQEHRDIERQQQALRESLDKDTAEDRAELNSLEIARDRAEATLIQARALAGAAWDPTHPLDEPGILRVERRSFEAVAADLGLPYPVSVRDVWWLALISWVLVVPAGIVLGLSVAILTHFVESDALFRSVPALCLAIGIGVGAAVGLKLVMQCLAEQVSERYYLSSFAWHPWFIGTALLCGIVLLADIVVQRCGVLASQILLLAALHMTPEGGFYQALWAMPLILNLGYLGTALAVGHYKARPAPILARIENRREAEYKTAVEQRRAVPQVQVALAATSQLAKIGERLKEVRQCIKAKEARHEVTLSKLDGQRAPIPPVAKGLP